MRQPEQPLGGQQQLLAPGSGEQRDDHQIAHGHRVDALAYLDDSGDALVAGDQRERRPQERAADEKKVVFVQGRELDSDPDLGGARRRRLRGIDDVQDVLWSSELCDLDGTHVDSLGETTADST